MKVFYFGLLIILSLSFCTMAKAQNTAKIPELENDVILSGTVFDPIGAVIVRAKVTALNQKGQKFETFTNEEGLFSLKLPVTNYKPNKDGGYEIREAVAKYEITVESSGFVKNVIKDFIVVPSWRKRMSLDIALEVSKPSLSPVETGNF